MLAAQEPIINRFTEPNTIPMILMMSGAQKLDTKDAIARPHHTRNKIFVNLFSIILLFLCKRVFFGGQNKGRVITPVPCRSIFTKVAYSVLGGSCYPACIMVISLLYGPQAAMTLTHLSLPVVFSATAIATYTLLPLLM